MGTTAAVLYTVIVFVVVINVPLYSATVCSYKVIRPSASYDGYITSPDYPSSISSECCIIWVYNGWPGMQVTIRFLDVDIPNYPDICSDNLLKIGPLNEHIYCGNIGSKNFEPYTANFTSSDYTLYIVFSIKSVIAEGRGFKLYFRFSDDNGMPSIPTTTMATTTSTILYSLKPDESSCHFVLTEQTRYIKTNKAVLQCLTTTGKATWQIFYPSIGDINFKCEIIFDECRVPYPDKLTVYDGYSNEDRVLGEYNEGLCPNFLISTSSALFLEYVSKSTGNLPSLKLQILKINAEDSKKTNVYETTVTSHREITETSTYRYIPPKNPVYDFSDRCDFHLSNQSGEINSDDIASMVQKSGFCTWLLHFGTADGQIVTYTLNVDRFHLSLESTFVIYDGADMTASVLGSNLPLTPSLSLISSQNSVFMYFNPAINVNSVGVSEVFTIKYQANFQCAGDYLPCGFEERACYRNSERCDNIWHCPLHGGDERGCYFECPSEFSCGFTTSVCYSENERCNGKLFCPNSMDELNCNKAQCSSDKGLFLCRSGHCIYENLRCDRYSDCVDGSDEDNCPAFMTKRVIIAAVAGSLLSALIVVISMGCICKVYRMRVRHLNDSQHHETPLSRHLSEMLRHRAPPPPYHEAMLTSRPYTEADSELLVHSEQHEVLGLLNTGYQDDIALTSSVEQTHRSHHQDSGHRLQHQTPAENQHQASVPRNGPGTLIEVGTLALFSESLQDGGPYRGAAGHDLQIDDSELPPYSETDPSSIAGSYPSFLRDENFHDDFWQRDFGNGVCAGDNSNATSASEFLIQMEMIPSNRAQNSASAQTSSSMVRNSNGMKSIPQRHHGDGTNGGNNEMETISTSTSLSIDSIRNEDMKDIHNDEIRENVNDSDSECILVEDNADDDSSESDTSILAHE